MHTSTFRPSISTFAILPALVVLGTACSAREKPVSDSAAAANAMRDSSMVAPSMDGHTDSAMRAGATGRTTISDTVLGNLILTVDRGEIEAGNLALTKATHASVKSYARLMIDAHTKDLGVTSRLLTNNRIARMDSTAPAPSGNLVSETAEKHKAAMEGLRAASGAAFDSTYMAAMVAGHQGFLQTLQQNTPATTLAPLKQHMTELDAVVADHLARAKDVQAQLSATPAMKQ